MLTELRAQNYKSYGSHTVLPLKRLTVFLGKNNSGKTAAIRIPLLLSTGLNGEEQTRRSVLPLRVRGLRYGSSIRDLIRGHSPHGQMALGASMCTEDARSIDVDVTIQSRQSLEQGASGFVSSFSSNLLADSVSWDPESSSETAIQYGARAVGFKGLVPRFDDERSVAADVIRKEFGGFLENLVHLTAMRSPTLPLYEQRTSTHQPSPDGAEVPFLLNENQLMLNDVSEWYSKNMNVDGIGLSSEVAAFQLLLKNASGATENLAEVGQGIQQVLPVVAYLSALERDEAGFDTLVIEEPELHLHPSAHGAVADLIVDSILKSKNSQVLVETHSENLILRLRRHVATGRLSPQDVNLLYFENVDGETRIREITIGPDGSVSSWPTGVFSEDLEEVKEISKAARR